MKHHGNQRFLKLFWSTLSVLLISQMSLAVDREIDIKKKHPRRRDTVLIRIKDGIDETQKSNLNAVFDRFEIEIVREIVGSGILELYIHQKKHPLEEIVSQEIFKSGLVEFAEPDYLVMPSYLPNDPNLSQQWQHQKMNSWGAWDLIKGGNREVLTAICDTGVLTTHPDLAPNLQLPGYNSADGSTNVAPVIGHGTFVAGMLAAAGDNAAGVAGVAYRVRLLPIRATNQTNGAAYFSDLVNCVQYAADHGVRVVNMSYGAGSSASIDYIAKYLRARGGLLFVAAGNSGADLGTGTPDFKSFLLVGATNNLDQRASFSSYGAALDLMAPGQSVYSTTTGNGYGSSSGTSFAAPAAAGAAALLFSINQNYTPDQVEQLLISTAKDLGAAGRDPQFGFGRVDVGAAVAKARGTTVNVPPVAKISGGPFTGFAPLTVNLDSSLSTDANGNLVQVQWTFGDSTPISIEKKPQHVYVNSGSYTLKLKVIDSLGSYDIQTVQVSVQAVSP